MKFSWSRLMLAIPAAASLALLSPVSADSPKTPASVHRASQTAATAPSKLDYVVLASVPDAPNLLVLYATSAHDGAIAPIGTDRRETDRRETDRR